jgi:hypothetical protein
VKPNDGPRWLPMAQAIRDRLPGVQWLPLPGIRVGVLQGFQHPLFPAAANDEGPDRPDAA